MASRREARLRGLGCDAVAVFAAFRARVDGIGALAGVVVADSAAIVVFRERLGCGEGEGEGEITVAVFAAISAFRIFVDDAGCAEGMATFDFVAVRGGISASFPVMGAVAVFAGFWVVAARAGFVAVADSAVNSLLPLRWLPFLPEVARGDCRFCRESDGGTGRRDGGGTTSSAACAP